MASTATAEMDTDRTSERRGTRFSGRTPRPASVLRRWPVRPGEARSIPLGFQVRFRVHSRTRPRAWTAVGIVTMNTLMDDGVLVISNEEGIRRYTIPWRYFADGLVHFEVRELP